jgi:site-specific recombinase XerC
MEHVGIDVHKNHSQICLVTKAGEFLHQRLHTPRERFAAVFTERPTTRMLLEASTWKTAPAKAKKAGAPFRSTPTSTLPWSRCRRGAVCKVSEAGGSLRDVQDLAGHASLAMTQRYIEGDTEAKRQLIGLM